MHRGGLHCSVPAWGSQAKHGRYYAHLNPCSSSASSQEQQTTGDGGLQTGTPLFAAVSTLDGGPHTLSSELETLFNVMLYTLSGGVLHWRGLSKEHHHLITVRRGAMLEGWFERVMLKRVEKQCWPALQRLRGVFFPDGGYRTDVSSQEFLDALGMQS